VSRVLVACEFSGVVRDAFIRAGHDAVSVDMLPSESTFGPHIQGDAIAALLLRRWDLVIAHPPCTYLANSGVRWLYGGKGTTPDPKRWAAMQEAAAFFEAFLQTGMADRVAVENPVMHRHAGIRKPDQFVQPWQFGHGETKATGLWLRNLPPLVPTEVVEGREQRVHRMPPGPDRWRERSRTFPGIAKAMADQWGPLLGTATGLAEGLGGVPRQLTLGDSPRLADEPAA
jgi:hypothetical protein